MAQLTDEFFKKILAMEGGYQDNPHDRGNYSCGKLVGTNMGVSAVALSTWLRRCVTVDDVKNLSVTDAKNFYSWYFDFYGLFDIADQRTFEIIANSTMGSPVALERIVNRRYDTKDFLLDGRLSKAVIDGINNDDQLQLYNDIRYEWIEYLKNLNKPEFLEGWLKRMDKYYPPLGGAGGFKYKWLFALSLTAGTIALALYGYKHYKK